MTYQEMRSVIDEHNRRNGVVRQFGDPAPLWCVIVYRADNWDTPYSLESRSYRFRSDNKRFVPGLIGSSVFASALDGSDDGVRLDWVDWRIENCYIENPDQE